MYSCNSKKPSPPEKHPNIPAKAFWRGGIDGGDWFECKKMTLKVGLHCNIYHDFTGQKIVEADFIPSKKIKSIVIEDIKSFDGKDMYLKNNVVLVIDGSAFFPLGDGLVKKIKYIRGVEIKVEQLELKIKP